jgi:4-alpha-glucanotransferase
MIFPRQSGLLLHPTSLPGRFGIGDLGDDAHKFVDLMADCNQHLWQILPVGLTGYGNSPYNSASIFAGNPLLINPDRLIQEELLQQSDLEDIPEFPVDKVDYNTVSGYKNKILRRAFNFFRVNGTAELTDNYISFCNQYSVWLDTYSLYMALKEYHRFSRWQDWPEDIKFRKPGAIDLWTKQLKDSIEYYKYEQFLFNLQWNALKKHCKEKNISIIGDMPIFIDADSDSVWENRDLFDLREDGNANTVAGVPPDYFSSTGQLWGNPTYNWDKMRESNYKWWKDRFLGMLSMVDIIRLDHFKGFESYWEIPADADTAVNGRWVSGPGEELFHLLEKSIGPLSIIAEDLGVITDSLKKLRDNLGFPGMRVLQFGFTDDTGNDHTPYNFIPHCVAYTGTHDNDTTVGWFQGTNNSTTLSEAQLKIERSSALKYTGTDGHEIHWDFIRMALSSVANTAIIPLQDLMGLDSSARMNTPSTVHGNWEWRFRFDMLTDDILDKFKEMTFIYGRNNHNGGQ